jgi:hypothetical protein
VGGSGLRSRAVVDPGDADKKWRAACGALGAGGADILKRVPRVDNDMLFPSRVGEGRSFSGFSKAKERLAALSAVDEFTLHDLRRTVATRLASLGAAPHVIERLLNHVTGILGGVAGVYNRFKYHDEIRAALVQWTSHMRQLAGPGFCGSDAAQTLSPAGAPALLREEVQLADSVVSATRVAREICTR